ncbi:MAG: hypothetical protein KGY66_05990 [Candidatus Thermoplasmatota archaeon]|nr:hypothetical protein [Candidatus Thermoplasmatota archaeon]MBS3790450.1 hypothetical protein [Candidatus Thermoplasmatota archaeon]
MEGETIKKEGAAKQIKTVSERIALLHLFYINIKQNATVFEEFSIPNNLGGGVRQCYVDATKYLGFKQNYV